MGCFSITCGMSKLPIKDMDDVVFFPMFKDSYSIIDELHLSPTIISNSGSMALYTLLTLPIFGKYNDYGSMRDIVMDENTNLIETYLKQYDFNSIQSFVDILCMDGLCRVSEQNITGMFVLREVYENMISDIKMEYDKIVTREEYGLSFDKLIKMGEQDSDRYIYDTYMKHGGFSFGGFDADKISYDIYFKHITNPYIKERFIDLAMFNLMMFYTNSLFMPQISGSQSGNYYAHKQLAKLSLDISNKRLNN